MFSVPSARDSSSGAPDAAYLAKEIGGLSAQNERLSKSVDTLLRLHEDEKTQRRSLQTTLDRLLEEIRVSTSAQSLAAVGTEVRNGVSEDLKPLLHAIIDLLELSMRRVPTPSAVSIEPSETTDTAGSHDGSRSHDNASGQQLPPEDLPGALPEILTKSMEELVGRRRASRQKNIKPDGSRPNAQSPAGENKTSAVGNDRRTPAKGLRPQAWIPVTSSTIKP